LLCFVRYLEFQIYGILTGVALDAVLVLRSRFEISSIQGQRLFWLLLAVSALFGIFGVAGATWKFIQIVVDETIEREGAENAAKLSGRLK